MTLQELAQRHVEQLTAAVEQTKRLAEAHRQKAAEAGEQKAQLEAELSQWREALEG